MVFGKKCLVKLRHVLWESQVKYRQWWKTDGCENIHQAFFYRIF